MLHLLEGDKPPIVMLQETAFSEKQAKTFLSAARKAENKWKMKNDGQAFAWLRKQDAATTHAIKLSSADQPAASMQLAEEAKEVLEDDVAQAET